MRCSPVWLRRTVRDREIAGSNPVTSTSPCTGNTQKGTIFIKEISKSDLEKLLNAGVIRNTSRGFVNRKGYHIGYYRTRGCAGKRYIQDYYADKAKSL